MMVKHRSWRIVAIILTAVIFILIYARLVNNSENRLKQIFTGDFAYTIAGLTATLEETERDSTEILVQRIIQQFKSMNRDIQEIAYIEDRIFLAHTDTTLIGSRINKEIFDAQRELEKNFDSAVTAEPYVIWRQAEGPETQFDLYYPVREDEGFKGTIQIKIKEGTVIPIKLNHALIFFIFPILTLLLIFTDRFLGKFNTILAILLFVLLILMINNNLKGQMIETAAHWDSYKAGVYEEVDDYLRDNTEAGLPRTEAPDLELPFKDSIDVWNYTLSILAIFILLFIFTGMMENFFETILKHRLAYLYILPAMFGVFLLVFFPFIYGILIGFTDYNLTNFGGNLIEYFSNLENYGFDNFYNILRIINFRDYSNFYFTLTHTVVWTISNLIFHVSIGVVLALVLNDATLKGRTVFRILLILPWAIPNYITALIWRGMFHKQFGAVNGFLELLGFESISWFTQPFTSFLANLATNVWLGFPFMMIIALGALQSIPKELYEASAIDGSSKWQAFWNVTVPLLRPAMVPAIILGTIWTFNQFNVIYLVSAGGPDGATELLITDAYKYAFEQYRYGYAAAYCIIIFAVLLGYGMFTSRITKATSGAYE